MSADGLDLPAIALRLRDAQAARTCCAPLRTSFPAMTIEDAYEVQRLNIDHALAAGGRLIGRKIGLTSRAVQTQLGVGQPDFGALFAHMSYGDGEEMPWSMFLQPRVEAEILFVLGRDLPHGHVSVTDVIAAVDHVLPAIEVVDSRIAKWDIGIVDTVADNASCGAMVVGGSPRRLRDVDLRLCGMVIERRGEPISLGAGAACLGHPLNAVVWLARKMVDMGTPLAAGDVVLSGALGPMVAARAGDVCEARISGVGSVRAVFEAEAAA